MGTFFSRPIVEPLDLNFVDLKGGGSHPSLFDGRTDDGRNIHIRYRGGRLRIEDTGETDPARALLLEAFIAPWPHGEIRLEQVCDLAGLTIRGRRPELGWQDFKQAATKERLLDFSGRTTCWVRNLVLSATGERMLAASLLEEFPDLWLLQTDWDREMPPYERIGFIRKQRFSEVASKLLVVGFCMNWPEDKSGQPFRFKPDELDEAFSIVVRLNLPSRDECHTRTVDEKEVDEAGRWTGAVGRPLRFAYGEWSQFSCQFETASEASRAKADKIIAALDRISTDQIGHYEAVGRSFIHRPTAPDRNWYSIDCVDRCRRDEDCWLAMYRDPPNSSHIIGVRPLPPG